MRADELTQLLERRKELGVELRTHHDAMWERAKDTADKLPTAEDDQEFKRLESEMTVLNRRWETEKRTDHSTQFNADAASWGPSDGGPKTFEEYRSLSDSRHFLHGSQINKAGVDTPDYRQVAYKWLATGRENLDMEEYRVLSKGASGGGFFVPTDLADNIVRAERFLPGGVNSLARRVTTSAGDTINIPRNLTHGTAAWIAESGSYTPSDETITQGTISAFKAGTKIIVSEELLTDSAFDLSSFIATEFGERIGALQEDAWINGDGTGKPTGILDAASAVTVTTLPAGQVTTTTYAAVAAAVLTVPAQYRQNLSLLVADSVFVRFVTLVDSTGRPIWSPSMAAGAPDRVLGIPLYTHPNLPAIGANAKSMIVGDFGRGYLIRQVDGVFMQRQNEIHSDSGQVGFRGYHRVDGKVQLADALRIIAFAAT